MTGNEILRADLLDIVFNNRNKQYGAYTLRKFYNHRLILSLSLSLALVLLLFFIFNMDGAAPGSYLQEKKELVLRTVVLPEPVAPKPATPPKQVTAAAPVAQRMFVSRVAIEQTVLHPTIPPNSMPGSVAISDVTRLVPSGGGIDLPTGDGNGVKGNSEIKPETNTTSIQREPEFPGGMEAWLRFLNRNLMSPEELELGEKRTVLIRFEVATDGSVTGFQVINSAGKEFDDEVIRVLKKMPRWKPAIQNGQPVPRSYTQPVSFVGQ
jgi:periplasmic protein TonB